MEEIQIIIEPNTVNPNSNTANTPVVAGTAGLTSTSAFYLPSPGSRLKLANTDNLGASPTSSDIRNWQELVLPSDTDEDKQQEQNKQTKPPILTPTHLSKAEPRLLPSLRILANSTYLPQVTNAPKGISLPPPVLPRGITLPEPARANPAPRVSQNSAAKKPLCFYASSRANAQSTIPHRQIYRPLYRPLRPLYRPLCR